MKKILVTGAAGFIGSHLTELLVSKGYKVTAFDRYNSYNSFGWLDNSKFKKKINFILGDIRDFDSVYKASKNQDIIFHLAALIGIPYSYYSPAAYIKTNVEGTYNILEASKINKVKQIIVTSTSETYGTAETFSIKESHRSHAQSPYAASKVSADQLALSYYMSFNTPVKIIRPFNTYGPRQSLRAVIPTIISQAINKNNIYLGNVDTSRDLTFVTDTVNAFIKVMNSKKLIGEAVNVGSNNNLNIRQLVEIISNLLNKKLNIILSKNRIRPSKSEVNRLRCNYSKIKSITGWKPKKNVVSGIEETIRWVIENKNATISNKYVI